MKNLFKTILFSLTLSACYMDPVERIVFFENYSNDSVKIYMAIPNYWIYLTSYPDTFLPRASSFKNPNYMDNSLVYPPHSRIEVLRTVEKENDFFHDVLPHDTLSFFVISNDTIRKYGYDTVAKENNILVRYDLSIPDMKAMGYNFYYPPIPAMKNVKMCPIYETFLNNKD